jgi:hypothetical protein
MNEKSKNIFYCYIGVFVLGLWSIGASVAAGIGWSFYHSAAGELSAIRNAKPAESIQFDLAKAETEHDAAFRELDLANQRIEILERNRRRTIELANEGIGLIQSARSTTGDITETVRQLRDNHNRLATIIIRIADNYNSAPGEFESGIGTDAVGQ